ncbi:MAG: DNA-binding protein [Bacteroides sp.]|nr:DNA-binding protein [Bacteroides sp.]
MAIPVKRYKRHKIFSDPTSPVLNYLKPVPGHSRTHTIEDAAREIETTGAMSVEDVVHVMKSFVRRLRIILTQGDKIKIDGLGTFHVTFNCDGTENEKDCTVRNIRKVNVRFMVDNSLRLVNDSIASTRGGDNNVTFYIKGDTESLNDNTNTNPGDDNGDGDQGSGNGGGGNGGGFIDPAA